MALTESTMLELGTVAPDFVLTDAISGKSYRRDDLHGEKGLLVVFICVHCPFVKHIERSLAAFARDYAGKPVGMVAISANDAANYPEDNPAGLKQQAANVDFSFPYLYDETQAVAHAYHAACTPDFFLFDGDLRLVYRGEFDRSRPGNGVAITGEDLRAAMDAVLAGKPPLTDQRPSVGCNIKWKA
jgi:hypothetical protein